MRIKLGKFEIEIGFPELCILVSCIIVITMVIKG